MTAICKQCRFVHAHAKSDPWWRWMCTEFAVVPELNHVTGDFTEPYGLCKTINRVGQCPQFEAGNNVFNPKDATE
jgi:hypothetical protein